ncbi:MAG: hypothetical protein SNJ59_09670 [Aggregatilineales bacterium]
MALNSLRRYIRAFFQALILTLRGEQPPALRAETEYPQTYAWFRITIALVKQTEEAAAAHGLDAAALVEHIEGRDLSLATALETIRFHAAQEYPHLLRNADPHARLAINAANMNDQYWVARFCQLEQLPEPVRAALAALGEHLSAVPDERKPEAAS